MSLRRNSVWNLIGSAIPFLLGIITIPYLLNVIGVELFGILSLIWTLIGYFSFFDFGLGRALTQQVAACLASQKNHELSVIIKTGIIFVFFTGLAGSILLLLFSHGLGYHWLNVSQTFQFSTFYSLLITAIGIPLTTLTSGFKGILEAYEDFRIVNILKIFLGIANFGFPVISTLIFGSSLIMIVCSLIFARLIILSLHIIFVNKKISLYTRHIHFEKKKLSKLLSFGIWMTVSNIISPLMVVADRFIISSIMGASVVAYYTVPADILVRVLIIPAALTTTLFPRLSALLVSNRLAAKDLFNKSIRIILIIMLPICLFIAGFSFLGLKIWIGDDFAFKSWKIASILAMGILFNGIAQVPYAKIQADGKTKITAVLHTSEVIVYIPMLLFLLSIFGLVGAAVAWVFRAGLDLFLLYNFSKDKTK